MTGIKTDERIIMQILLTDVTIQQTNFAASSSNRTTYAFISEDKPCKEYNYFKVIESHKLSFKNMQFTNINVFASFTIWQRIKIVSFEAFDLQISSGY